MYTCPNPEPLPTSLPIPSLESSQCTGLERPVSCIEPGLASCFTYNNTHVSTLFSQIIPPSPSPTECKRLFFTCVSLLSHIQGHRYHPPKFHIYALVYCIGVFFVVVVLCLTSLCMVGSSFIHLIRTDSNAIFLIAE